MQHIRPHRSPLPPQRHFLRFLRFLLQFPDRLHPGADRTGALPRPLLPSSRVCHWTALPPRLGRCNRNFNNDQEAHAPKKTHGCDTDDHAQTADMLKKLMVLSEQKYSRPRLVFGASESPSLSCSYQRWPPPSRPSHRTERRRRRPWYWSSQ